jgi:CobQ-like glutamine amidotransferase family enzyme
MTMSARQSGNRTVRIVHLFPDLLNVYGDAGNVRTIVVRSEARGFAVELSAVRANAQSVPPADVLLIGGGQDREQIAVARELERLGPEIRNRIRDGASLLAVCGGYQGLGWSYEAATGTIDGPGILDLRTVAGSDRLVGPVVATPTSAPEAWRSDRKVIGFENHAGRTLLGDGARAFAQVEIGHGNNGYDGTEGYLALPGDGGLGGLRIGTYLHGPFLPRNPHIADALISFGLGRGDPPVPLAELDDREEWAAHDRFVTRSREHRQREDRVPDGISRIVDPIRSLIGF